MSLENYILIPSADRKLFDKYNQVLKASETPVYLNYDAKVQQYWDKLYSEFPDFQFILIDKTSNEPVGRGHSVPLEFKESFSELHGGGLDWVLEKAFSDRSKQVNSNIQSALFITISTEHVGQGISYKMLAAMKSIGRSHCLTDLIAPVRPTFKSRYPLISMESYIQWKNEKELPFDPWIRVHVRAGGEIIQPCNEAMAVEGTISDWEEWTSQEFPGSGRYTIPGGLIPLEINLEKNLGNYIEPGVWILHRLSSIN